MPSQHPAVAAVRLAVRRSLTDLGPGSTVLVACSGGADSLALAAVAAYFARRGHVDGRPVAVGAVVVDHQLQAGSSDVAARTAETLRELGLDPVELRCRNAMEEGAATPTGQVIDSLAPVVELLRRLEAMPLPEQHQGAFDLRDMPGGVSNTTHGEGVRRGVGYAVAYKNVAFSEGYDEFLDNVAEAREKGLL